MEEVKVDCPAVVEMTMPPALSRRLALDVDLADDEVVGFPLLTVQAALPAHVIGSGIRSVEPEAGREISC